MRRRAALALAGISLLAVVAAVLVVASMHQSTLFDDSDPVVALISADDLESSTYVDPAQLTEYKDLKKAQLEMQKKIVALENSITHLEPEKTRVIVQVAPPGLPGPVGPKGDKGPVGPRGQRGLPGNVGSRGPRGPIGNVGRIGRPGVRGVRGFRGPRGEQGERGDEGDEGKDGREGDKGPNGPLGRPGPPGPTGENGLNGAPGPEGQKGARGPPGGVGQRGAVGPDVHCKFVDVCGVCDGDESSCATKKTPDSCHAVGDPHYRTFDGFTFNYQNTGEFILSKHLDDFEVQNKQRVCPNPDVRCNMAIAIRSPGHILIFYADWGMGSVLLDGQQISVTPEVRHDVTADLWYATHGNGVNVNWKDVVVHIDTNPWANTFYMDVYIQAPARWSNGRSLTGLCWTFNNDINDDPGVLAVAAQFWVGGSEHSLFDHPKPLPEGEKAGQAALIAAEAAVSDQPGAPDTNPPEHGAHHNIVIAFKNEAERLRAQKACDGVHGHDLQDCMYDVVAGEPGDNAGDAANMANLIDHEKLFQVCIKLVSSPSASFAPTRFDAQQSGEGFGYAFWYAPIDGAQPMDRSIFGKGDQQIVTVPANTMKIQVRMGNSVCTTQGDFPLGTWTHVAIGVEKGGAITVFVSGQPSCTNDGGQAVKIGNEPLIMGVPGTPAAKCRIARFFYVPLTLEQQDVKRYSERIPPAESCPL